MEQAEGIQHQDIVPVVTPGMGQEAPNEKVLRQSEVNELLGKAKHASYEKGKRDALEDATQHLTPQNGGQSLGGMAQITEDQVRQMIADEAHKQNQLANVNHVLTNFAQQMHTGKGKYSDFDETVASLGELKNIAQIVDLATGTGMAGDIMYELGKNPSKVASFMTLAYINPDLAKAEMKKVADSIKVNEQAAQSPSPNEPLSQIRPSAIAGKDNGSNSVRDLRRKPWAKG